MLAKLGAKRLYVRFFDIDYQEYSEVIVPIGRIENGQTFPKHIEIVPVIFIKNRIFGEPYPDADPNETADVATPAYDAQRLLDSAGVRDLAEKIVRKTLRMADRYSEQAVKEIQLDCDWSQHTKSAFFYLVSEVKRLVAPTTVSVTIRLHQFRYPEHTGVPPADRGTLMYYNMSKLRDTNTRNYVLDNIEGEKYLKGAKTYPLPLDFALPIHTQGSVFATRDIYSTDDRGTMRFSGLITGELFEQLNAEGENFQALTPNTYRVLKPYSNHQNNTWLQENFVVRYDRVSNEALHKAAELIAPLANTDRYHVTFFHLDPLFIADHPHETLARIVDQFR